MWFKTLLFVSLLLAVSSNELLFNKFKINHGKSYQTESEHKLRYAVFKGNLNKIQEHNAKYNAGSVSWYLAVNQFSDMTSEEFVAYLNAVPFNKTKSELRKLHVPALNIPDSIDWRERGAVTAVKNQGGCGSCWAFSATGTLEGVYAIKSGQLLSLSEQNLIDCCTSNSGYSADGCDGGIVQSGLDYVRDHGIATEDAYPYEAYQGSCRAGDTVIKSTGYTEINQNDENDLKNAVGSVGPVSVAMNADLLQSYGGGIFADTSCSTAIDHGVLVVGYGTENGQDYWIVKNSWGAGWGESGYFRMAIGHNLCAIAQQACYPIL
ncbi:unnamed protein product [Ceutorhynchus assimilis]|uniref:Cathepsin L n=1 Tax=Ceutorhynchus assimilis TaxID=467358 RepID=A0A9N9MMX0_9CUCU|nr:unnamed protein product [Ceutorhynchus assimilis]